MDRLSSVYCIMCYNNIKGIYGKISLFMLYDFLNGIFCN